MTTTRRANGGGSADAINLSSGTIRELMAVGLVGADGALIGSGGVLNTGPIGTAKAGFLGTAGIVSDAGATTSTANSTTAVYAQVPTGKVWRISALTGLLIDTSASVGTLINSFVAQSTPASGQGLRIRTVDTDTTTTLSMFAESILNNALLLLTLDAPLTAFVPATTNNVILGTWRPPAPIVLTAGQRFEIKHAAAVNYTIGVWRIQYAESDA